jgi:NADPH:quinone reductase-like Zn-dependent oxidoreductase
VNAAALPQAGLLAALGLSGVPEVDSGSRVLVNGAGGGVGTLAVQLAKLQGAHVTAVDSAAKLEAVRAAGADRAVDYAVTDFTRTGEHYDRILDVVAGRSPLDFARSLAPRGRLAVVGGTPGALLGVATLGTVLGMVTGKRLGVVIHKVKSAELERLASLCIAGRLTPVIDGIYPLKKIQDAFARFASGQFVGKIVVSVDAAFA